MSSRIGWIGLGRMGEAMVRPLAKANQGRARTFCELGMSFSAAAESEISQGQLWTPEQRGSAARVVSLLGARAAGIFDRATMHVPIETARDARETAGSLGADCAVAIGGGSTIGLGKAIALDS